MPAPFVSPVRLKFATAFAGAALTCVPAPLLTEPPASQTAPSAVEFAARPVDVKLSGGVLKGRLVDGSGAPIAHTPVALHRGGDEQPLAKAVTAEDGSFRLSGVPTGTAAVVTARGSQAVRVWDNPAPPKALDELALVSVDPAVRGNYGLFCDPALNLSMGIGVAAVVLGAVTLGEIEDLQDDNRDLRRQLDRIEDFVSP